MLSELPGTFLTFSVHSMESSQRTIEACLARLTEPQMLHRGGDYENSIANLLLHLSGNLRQWILHGIDHQPNVRTRDEEFSLHPTTPVSEIRRHFAVTLAEARAVIAALPASRLLQITDPQPGGGWGNPTALEAIYRVVSHLELHTGQIILLTKQLTRADLDLSLPRKRDQNPLPTGTEQQSQNRS
jgi:uncharacterized damage-inducible protein DinB